MCARRCPADRFLPTQQRMHFFQDGSEAQPDVGSSALETMVLAAGGSSSEMHAVAGGGPTVSKKMAAEGVAPESTTAEMTTATSVMAVDDDRYGHPEANNDTIDTTPALPSASSNTGVSTLTRPREGGDVFEQSPPPPPSVVENRTLVVYPTECLLHM